MRNKMVNEASLNIPGPMVLGLQALGHVAGDPDLGPRFLALSGLDSAGLRAGAGEPALLAAVIDFLCARESDLIACAQAMAVTPAVLVAAGTALTNAGAALPRGDA
jgi:hypothetical protein